MHSSPRPQDCRESTFSAILWIICLFQCTAWKENYIGGKILKREGPHIYEEILQANKLNCVRDVCNIDNISEYEMELCNQWVSTCCRPNNFPECNITLFYVYFDFWQIFLKPSFHNNDSYIITVRFNTLCHVGHFCTMRSETTCRNLIPSHKDGYSITLILLFLILQNNVEQKAIFQSK